MRARAYQIVRPQMVNRNFNDVSREMRNERVLSKLISLGGGGWRFNEALRIKTLIRLFMLNSF